jgi:iron complex outermembrane recepter protein
MQLNCWSATSLVAAFIISSLFAALARALFNGNVGAHWRRVRRGIADAPNRGSGVPVLLGLLTASLALGSFPAVAADGISAPPSPRDSSTDQRPAKATEFKLDEIIVTARRREEDLQSIPVAVTVVSQQTLQNNNIQVLEDLHYLVPSLLTSMHANREEAEVSIRGQGPGSQNSTPGVVMYLNEVPVVTSFDGGQPGGPGLFFDLENVQVLKGPQGTLFGRNTMGGAILLQTARPTNEFGGNIQVGYGNYNDREIDGAVNIPIVEDKLLARVAINGQLRDGTTHVLSEPSHPNGIDLDNRDSRSVRGTLTFHPIESIQNDTIVTYQKYTNHGTASFLTGFDPTGLAAAEYPNFNFAALVARQQALGARTLAPLSANTGSAGTIFALEDITRVTLSDGLTFRNIVGVHEGDFVYQWDGDSTPLPIFDVVSNDYRNRQITEEAQLLGKTLDEKLDWIVGAFYLDEEPPHGFGYNGYERLLIDLFQGTLLANPDDGSRKKTDESKALFTQGTYDLTSWIPHLKATAGVRYTWDDRFLGTLGAAPGDTAPSVCDPSPAQRVNCDYATATRSQSSALTYTVGLDYQVAPSTLVYVASRRGYRPGGSNGVDAKGFVLPQFSPEYVTDYELGVKADWNIGNIPIRTNAAIYYQNYTDIQVQQLFDSHGLPTSVTGNAAAAKLWGSELEVLAQLTRSLQVGVNVDTLHFEYTNFGVGVSPAALQSTAQGDRTPLKYGLSARYDLPIPQSAGGLSVRANYAWQDRSGTFLTPYMIPAYGLLNLSANWDGMAGTHVDGSLFVSNVADKVYAFGGVQVFGLTQTIYGDPRMYGVRVRYRFGAK